MAKKTLFERYRDEVLTDNIALNYFAQCKTCAFRDKTTVRGKECGWDKDYCQIYSKERNVSKPDAVYKNKAKCAYYKEEKIASREDAS